jgi:hypothetical protein
MQPIIGLAESSLQADRRRTRSRVSGHIIIRNVQQRLNQRMICGVTISRTRLYPYMESNIRYTWNLTRISFIQFVFAITVFILFKISSSPIGFAIKYLSPSLGNTFLLNAS